MGITVHFQRPEVKFKSRMIHVSSKILIHVPQYIFQIMGVCDFAYICYSHSYWGGGLSEFHIIIDRYRFR